MDMAEEKQRRSCSIQGRGKLLTSAVLFSFAHVKPAIRNGNASGLCDTMTSPLSDIADGDPVFVFSIQRCEFAKLKRIRRGIDRKKNVHLSKGMSAFFHPGSKHHTLVVIS